MFCQQGIEDGGQAGGHDIPFAGHADRLKAGDSLFTRRSAVAQPHAAGECSRVRGWRRDNPAGLPARHPDQKGKHGAALARDIHEGLMVLCCSTMALIQFGEDIFRGKVARGQQHQNVVGQIGHFFDDTLVRPGIWLPGSPQWLLRRSS